MRLYFSDVEIDTECFELRRGGESCKTEPKVFDLLVFLAHHPHQVFSHEALIEEVWNGRPVAETSISTCIKQAHRLLGDDGTAQRFIKTVRGRGYRLDAEVKAVDDMPDKPAARLTAAPRDDAATPALLVLPPRALSNDGMAPRLAATLVAELTTLLGRIPLLRLALHPDCGDEQAGMQSVRTLHEEYGVDYVLDGTLLYSQDRYRLHIQLADARSGFQRWCQSFIVEGPFDTAVQQAPQAVIAKLEPQIHRAIADDVRAVGAGADPQRLFLAAHSLLALKGWRHEAFEEAAGLCSRELAPDFALAPALLSLVMGFGDRIRLISEREQTRAEALEAAQAALSLDAMDSTVLGRLRRLCNCRYRRQRTCAADPAPGG